MNTLIRCFSKRTYELTLSSINPMKLFGELCSVSRYLILDLYDNETIKILRSVLIIDFSSALRSDPLPAIRQCADAAREKGYSFFALQSYGDCYIGNDDTLETYDSGGKSTICSSGSGGVGSNFVFKLGEPIRELVSFCNKKVLCQKTGFIFSYAQFFILRNNLMRIIDAQISEISRIP